MTEAESADGATATGHSLRDGRVARRERNVEAVLDAVIALVGEGNIDPTSEQIASRAGVSHRSIYRYFDGRHELLEAAARRVMQRVAPLLELEHPGSGSFEDRVAALVAVRVRTYMQFAPIARAAFRLAETEAVVGGAIDGSRKLLRDQLVEQFAPEVAQLPDDQREVRLALLDVAFQFESLEFFTGHLSASPDDLHRLLSAALRLHLEPR